MDQREREKGGRQACKGGREGLWMRVRVKIKKEQQLEHHTPCVYTTAIKLLVWIG